MLSNVGSPKFVIENGEFALLEFLNFSVRREVGFTSVTSGWDFTLPPRGHPLDATSPVTLRPKMEPRPA